MCFPRVLISCSDEAANDVLRDTFFFLHLFLLSVVILYDIIIVMSYG